MSDSPRLGIVVCDCGGTLGRTTPLEPETLARAAADLPGVTHVTCETCACGPDGRARLQAAVQAEHLDRVLVAACAPRLVEPLFRATVQAAGLPADAVAIADLREQCACVHAAEPEAAQAKAVDLIAMGAARLAALTPAAPRLYPLTNAAVVIGGGLGALTVALTLAEGGTPVTVIDPEGALGGLSPSFEAVDQDQIAARIAAARAHPLITVRLNAQVIAVAGAPGEYQVTWEQDGVQTVTPAGAVVAALGAAPQPLGTTRWYPRARVRTQSEFEMELAALAGTGTCPFQHVVIQLCAERGSAPRSPAAPGAGGRCSRLCCRDGLRQATRVKQLNPATEVTLLFRDLVLGDEADAGWQALAAAQAASVAFVRYDPAHPPVIDAQTVSVPLPATRDLIELPFDRLVLALPWAPAAGADRLAAVLGLPRDADGFLIERRFRLRPGHYADDGLFVLGGLHQPVSVSEVEFQAYLTGARVLRYLGQGRLQLDAPIPALDEALCTGCAQCVQVCPQAALSLSAQPGPLSRVRVDGRRCTGCGSCVAACPVRALTLPGAEDAALFAQIEAALATADGAPRVVVFGCEWSGDAAAGIAGARGWPYPANTRLIRLGCSARLSGDHVLWAFLNGAAGVLVAACPAGECHHGQGNRFAQERVQALQAQLAERGVDPCRLRWLALPGDDGRGFATVASQFAAEVGAPGPRP